MMLKLQRIWLQLTADRKKFGACATCLAVGLLLWARIIIISNPPRTAIADDEANASATVADASTSDNPLGLANANRETVSVHLMPNPNRDPFLVSSSHFPKSNSLDKIPGEGGKSDEDMVEESEVIEMRFAAWLEAEVERLELEAVVMGGKPMAVINGTMFRLGEMIPAPSDESYRFELVEVRERSVVLECEGRRVELKIALPGGP